MNHSFRSIWNQSLGAWVAASETSRARGKKGTSRAAAPAALILGAAFMAGGVLAQPTISGSNFGFTVGSATAAGSNCIAMGGLGSFGGVAQCSDIDSLAIGNAAVATAQAASAFGTGSQATGAMSTAVGFQALASGSDSLAAGRGAQATGAGAVAVGLGARATGASSLSVGNGNVVSGNNSGAFGDPNTVSGTGSYAFGNNNTVRADNAFAMGNGVFIGLGLDGAVALGHNSTVRASSTSMPIRRRPTAARRAQKVWRSDRRRRRRA